MRCEFGLLMTGIPTNHQYACLAVAEVRKYHQSCPSNAAFKRSRHVQRASLVAFQVELCGGEPGARRGIDRERERDGESEGLSRLCLLPHASRWVRSPAPLFPLPSELQTHEAEIAHRHPRVRMLDSQVPRLARFKTCLA